MHQRVVQVHFCVSSVGGAHVVCYGPLWQSVFMYELVPCEVQDVDVSCVSRVRMRDV